MMLPPDPVPQQAYDLARRVVDAPCVQDTATATRNVDLFLKEHAGAQLAGQIVMLLDRSPRVRDLLEGISVGSPYLWELVCEDPRRLFRLLTSDPSEQMAALLSETTARCTRQPTDMVMRHLRRTKAEAALLIGLCDLGGVWALDEVTQALTALADRSVSIALDHALHECSQSGKFIPQHPDHPAQGSGLFVLAMGKMGAFELNYSSDIDLIVFYDAEQVPVLPDVEPGPLMVRVIRTVIKCLQERTAEGYVFRVDLRLRPDPSSTQIAISTESALNYYESIGQTWERSAYIKARICAGDKVAGVRFLREMIPFVWRKHLDYAAVADVHAMKRQIHAFKGHDQVAVAGHNVKIGRGGIREIEFFAQTQQMIAGGKDQAIRPRETLAALAALTHAGWITETTRDQLQEAYVFLRTIEHRLQMVADEQTHALPEDRNQLERLIAFAGFSSIEDFSQHLTHHLTRVQQHYARLFEDAPSLASAQGRLTFPPDKDDRETLDTLYNMGFSDPVAVSQAVREWMRGERPATRTEAARTALSEVLPGLLDRLAQTTHPNGAVIAFDKFLVGLKRGVPFLSALRRNPDLVQLIALILGTSPLLADIISRDASALDAVLDPRFFGALPDEATLTERLKRDYEASESHEDFLDRARMSGQEQTVLIGIRVLSGTASAAQAGEAFARLADVQIKAMCEAVMTRFIEQHGRIKGAETAVVALGKLGGREMTVSSDLDLVVLYDYQEDAPESDGPRPLYGSQYFARFTQRLIAALTAETNLGKLYDVDMRLRPSGRKGPVATHIAGFIEYHENESWTWEHMALTRARVVSGSPAFASRIHQEIFKILTAARVPDKVAGDVVEMRRAIALERGDVSPWFIKHAPGGMIDIEFIAQYLQLVYANPVPEILETQTMKVLDNMGRLGVLDVEEGQFLRQCCKLYSDLTQIISLCQSDTLDPATASPQLSALLSRIADVPDLATLEALLVEKQGKVRTIFTRILGAEP